jgi:DNA-binding IclR family transcriptional regulator
MHAHRSAGPPAGVARPGTPAFEPQRRLLLELAVDPPAGGESLAELSVALDLPLADLAPAAVALARLGLVERRNGRLYPTETLRAVEALWPLAR